MSLFVQTLVLGMSHCPKTNVIGNISLKLDSLAWGTNCLYLYVHSTISGVWGLVLFYIEVFQQSNSMLGKFLHIVHFAVLESSLASRKTLFVWPLTTHKLLVQVSRFVNASKIPTIKVKRKALFARTPFYCCNFWGTQTRDKSTWTTKHLKHSKVCPTKSANKVCHSRKALRPWPLASTLSSSLPTSRSSAVLEQGTS